MLACASPPARVCHSDVAYASGAWGGSVPAVYGHEAAGVVEEAGGRRRAAARRSRRRHARALVRDLPHLPARPAGALRAALRARRAEPAAHAPAAPRSRRACAPRAFAEQVVVHHSQAVPVPPRCRSTAPACSPAASSPATARSSTRPRWPPGDSAAVIGAGGVGLNCIQGAALPAPSRSSRSTSPPTGSPRPAAFGATHVVDPAADDARRLVRGLTDGRGVDCALVAAGATAAVELALRLVRRGGTVVIAGMPAVRRDGRARSGRHRARRHPHPRQQARLDPAAATTSRARRALPRGPPAARRAVSSRSPLTAINDALAAAARGEALRAVIAF